MHDARLALNGLSWVCYACRSKDSENSFTAIYEQQHSTEWEKAWVNGLWDILLLLHTLVHFTWWFVVVICTWYFLNECSRVLFKICGVSLSVMPNDMFPEIPILRIWKWARWTQNGFSPVCVNRCLLRSHFLAKEAGHCWHLNRFSPVCLLEWSFR